MSGAGRAAGRFGVVVWFLVALSLAHVAHAQDGPQTDATTYVSDKFKLVAKRLVEQIAVKTLEDACGNRGPICKLMIDRLSAAFIAALEKDTAGVKDALVGFFVDSAVQGAVELAVGGLLDAPRAKALRDSIDPLVRCLTARLTQKRPDACIIKEARKLATTQLKLDLNTCADVDCRAVAKLVTTIENGREPDVAAVIDVLAAIASYADHEDTRIYLLEVKRLVAGSPGIEGGFFPAVAAFMRAPAHLTAITTILAYNPADYTGPVVLGGPGSALMYPSADPMWATLRQACPEVDRAFAAWQHARDIGQFFAHARLGLLAKTPVDVAPLDDLMSAACHADNRQLVRFAAQLAAPLHARNLIDRGGAVLAAAALIDYLRFQDDKRLDRDVRELLLLSLTYNVLPGVLGAQAAGDPIATITDSCELQDLRHLMSFSATDAVSTSCVSLVAGGPNTTLAVLGIVGPPTAEETAARIADTSDVVARISEAATANIPDQTPAFDGIPIEELTKAVVYLAAGDKHAARKVLLRFGVTLLVDEVDQLSTRMLGKTADDCANAAKSTSIFRGIDAACAAHVLIQSAYYPIADFLWDAGLSASNISTTARQVYQSLLQNKALDRAPIILNVGLGAHAIWGHDDVWGTDAFTALTVIDKFGLAFYKHSETRWSFETGPFVGGFLDALVRTATGDGTEHRSWIAGWTIGFPRMAGVDLGLEAHFGAAIPFEFKAHEVGFVTGLSLVVPFSTLFQTGD